MEDDLARIVYRYYCENCSKYFKYQLDFDKRLRQYACPKCYNELKYKGGCDSRISDIGNCAYRSYEVQSNFNAKELGKDTIEQMENADSIIKYRKDSTKKENIPWWRTHKNPEKPLDLSSIKDTENYIMTGEI